MYNVNEPASVELLFFVERAAIVQFVASAEFLVRINIYNTNV